MTIQHIRDSCLKIKNEKGIIHRVFVDYLQLMQAAEGFNREQKISFISRNLKQLAKELDCPVIVLSQLSRSVENRPGKRPNLADLRESGAIEQDADFVGFWFRPEYYDIIEDEEGNDLKGVAIYIIGKNRHGSLDDIKMFFDADYTRFAPIEERPEGYESATHRNKRLKDEGGEFEWDDYSDDIASDNFLPDIEL
jgi:replicative DNA helicase